MSNIQNNPAKKIGKRFAFTGLIAMILLFQTSCTKPYENVWGKTYVANGNDQIVTLSFASYGLAENLGNKCVVFTIGDRNTGFIEHGRTSYTIVNDNTLFIPEDNCTFTIEGNGERLVTNGGTIYTRQ